MGFVLEIENSEYQKKVLNVRGFLLLSQLVISKRIFTLFHAISIFIMLKKLILEVASSY